MSSACRYASLVPGGKAVAAGTILHDWGAHLIDQAPARAGPCRRLTAWVSPAPWNGSTAGHGRIVLEFDGACSRPRPAASAGSARPRWWVVGTHGGLVKYGVDPQEEALHAGDLARAEEPAGHQTILRRPSRSARSLRSGWSRSGGAGIRTTATSPTT
ncbi:MAG: hypothetical protein U0835_20980 [Isosphaeraceae bacterium]